MAARDTLKCSCARFPRHAFEATINQHIAYITPRAPVVTASYLHLSLVAAYSTLRSISDDSGSTKGALTCKDLKRFKLAVPPIDEQERLVETIANETHVATTAIARTEREIALMQEYRTRLTADKNRGHRSMKTDRTCSAVSSVHPPGPFSGAMEDAQNFHGTAAHAIREDVRETGHDKLPRPGNAAWAPTIGVVREHCDTISHVQNELGCDARVVFCNVGGFVVQVLQRTAQPLNQHIFS